MEMASLSQSSVSETPSGTSGLWLSRTCLCKVGQVPHHCPVTQCMSSAGASASPVKSLSVGMAEFSRLTAWSLKKKKKKEHIFLYAEFRDKIAHF